MKESIKYDAEYFRKMCSDATEKQDIIAQADYYALLNRIKTHVESSKDVVYYYVVKELLGGKIKGLLIKDGFKVTESDDQREGPSTEISWAL